MRSILICVLFLFAAVNLLPGQSFLKREGTEIVNEAGEPVLLRGMGLGGWMLQEGYMFQTAEFAGPQWEIEAHIEELIGTEDKEAFYEAWYANHVTRADIEAMADWGFNLVRLPMHYNLFTLSIQEEPVEDEHTWLDKGFEMTDSLVSWCRDNNMYILLDLHAAPGGQGYSQDISDYNPAFPSLWEDNANKRKTIALWRRIAEYYADEPVIAGYDLLNEPNWDLPGGAALRALYGEITTAIREVDQKHALFIEGNWFANDFTGLTVPWDDNMVYAPHKYWSNNETEDLRWVLDLRDNTGYPIFFGESGENSNTWFRDAIKNFESNGMGWAWWPEKKVEDIAGPLSIVKTPEYAALLEYWKGNTAKPSVAEAKETLMTFAENLKIENCIFQKDVIDAMFRQVYSDETVPYSIQNIPGVVYMSDFDMGRNGFAYYDTEVGNYQLSTGEFTSWNNGWAYRNDGVDLERNEDTVNSNGYNVGWMDTGEWIQYSIAVEEAGVYQAKIRYASGTGGGQFHLETEDGAVSEINSLSSTLGWDQFRTYTLEDVVLTTQDEKLIFYVDNAGMNVSSLEFVKTGEITNVATTFLSAETLDQNTLAVTVNKPLTQTDISNSDFQIIVNGFPFAVTEVIISQDNKTFLVKTDRNFASSHIINLTYSGSAITATDGTVLEPFTQELVLNTLTSYQAIPGLIEAESFDMQSGIQLEDTSDDGGGQNIGYLEVGDYADYFVSVRYEGAYQVTYRTASESSVGQLELFLIEGDELIPLHVVSFPSTGGWQNWRSTSKELTLPQGNHQLRLVIRQPSFNINWMRFGSLTDIEETEGVMDLKLSPNPVAELLQLSSTLDQAVVQSCQLTDMQGKTLRSYNQVPGSINVSDLKAGVYFITIQALNGRRNLYKFIKL